MSQEKSTPQDIKGSSRNRTTSECSVASDDGAASSTFASKRYGILIIVTVFLCKILSKDKEQPPRHLWWPVD